MTIKVKQRYEDFVVQEISETKAEILPFPETVEEYGEQLEKAIDALHTERKEQLKCILQKRNIDLNTAIKRLSRKQKFSQKRIGYAGLKDKRAVTSQFITIYDPNLEELKKFRDKNIFLHSFEWSNKKIELGDLKENFFIVKLRNIDTQIDLKKTFNKIKKIKEMPNYFGEQRFGSIRELNQDIGRFFIQGKTKEAVELFLIATSDREKEETQEARALVKEGNYAEAIRKFPKENHMEKAILNSLIKNPNDYNNAWLQISKSITFLFVHAYQSYLFNKYINTRLEKYSLDSMDGDILDEEGFVLGPLFGFEFTFATKESGKLEKKILKEENMGLEDFHIKNFPQMSSKGTRKRIKLLIKNLKLVAIQEDDFNEDKQEIIISFTLDKGNYATTVLDYFIKNAFK